MTGTRRRYDPGFMEFSAQVGPGQSQEEARDALLDLLEKLEKEPTHEELHRARAGKLAPEPLSC